ncbi:hypothetical protein ACHAWF_003380 [Thalassiosira exigua]
MSSTTYNPWGKVKRDGSGRRVPWTDEEWAAIRRRLKNKRLKDIRDEFEDHKPSPPERSGLIQQAGRDVLDGMRRNGACEATIALCARVMEVADEAMEAGMAIRQGGIVAETIDPDFDPYERSGASCRGKSRRVTVTSEGSRHWRTATVRDVGSIVYLPHCKKFGKFAYLGSQNEETGEEQPWAVVYTFSGRRETGAGYNDIFEELLVVPDAVLRGVKNEAPPGRFFSGKELSGRSSAWSPAPPGQTWLEHPFTTNPRGMYMNDRAMFFLKMRIQCPDVTNNIRFKAWEEHGRLAYWCPVLKRFLSEGERLRQEHWFHNGDGSAQQRYFYNQNEMLDMHGGLKNLPTSVDAYDEDVCLVGVMGPEEVIAKRRQKAEANGEIIEIDSDSNMPAKRRRTK